MPKIHNVEQGTTEWLALRLGIPTASEFDKIVTPTGQLSKQSRKYAFYLIAEKLLNRPLDGLDHLEWVQRGKEMEPQAVSMYEFENEAQTQAVGFMTSDDGRMGASPDRLIVGKNAGLEIKCPAPQTHIAYMLDGFGKDYYPQVQGQILVGEFDYVERYSYHPEMPPVKVRTDRDEPFIKTLSQALDGFCDMKDELLEQARQKGMFAERKKVQTAVDQFVDDRAYVDHLVTNIGADLRGPGA